MTTQARKPRYGYDAPVIVKRMMTFASLSFIALFMSFYLIPSSYIKLLVIMLLIVMTISFLFPAIAILLGSTYFKFRERDWLFDQLNLQGNETVLDIGCGHGLLLIAAAKRLKTGKAIGLDLWVLADQADNSLEETSKNAKLEGVQDKVKILSGDMRSIQLPDKSIDVVVSSWAIHNIYDEKDRESTLSEIMRVLKPGGRIAILDIDHAPSYKSYFVKNGMRDVKLIGPRYTFGNKTYLVLASSPLH